MTKSTPNAKTKLNKSGIASTPGKLMLNNTYQVRKSKPDFKTPEDKPKEIVSKTAHIESPIDENRSKLRSSSSGPRIEQILEYQPRANDEKANGLRSAILQLRQELKVNQYKQIEWRE